MSRAKQTTEYSPLKQTLSDDEDEATGSEQVLFLNRKASLGGARANGGSTTSRASPRSTADLEYARPSRVGGIDSDGFGNNDSANDVPRARIVRGQKRGGVGLCCRLCTCWLLLLTITVGSVIFFVPTTVINSNLNLEHFFLRLAFRNSTRADAVMAAYIAAAAASQQKNVSSVPNQDANSTLANSTTIANGSTQPPVEWERRPLEDKQQDIFDDSIIIGEETVRPPPPERRPTLRHRRPSTSTSARPHRERVGARRRDLLGRDDLRLSAPPSDFMFDPERLEDVEDA